MFLFYYIILSKTLFWWGTILLEQINISDKELSLFLYRKKKIRKGGELLSFVNPETPSETGSLTCA